MLTKGRNTHIFLGNPRILPSIWEQPFLQWFFPVVVMESVTCNSAVECVIQHAGGIRKSEMLTLAAILRSTQLASQLESSFWTGGDVFRDKQDKAGISARSDKQSKSRAWCMVLVQGPGPINKRQINKGKHTHPFKSYVTQEPPE